MGREEFIEWLRIPKKPNKYIAPKGTAKQKSTTRKRIAALVAAGLIVLGASGCSKNDDKTYASQESYTISDMKEQGIELNDLGLTEETVEEIKYYDEFLNNIDIENTQLDKDEMNKIVEGYLGLHLSILKQKIANATGENATEMKLMYDTTDPDRFAKVIVGGKTKYREGDVGISKQIADEIRKAGEIDDLLNKSNQKKTIDELKEYFGETIEVATGKVENICGQLVIVLKNQEIDSERE